MFNLQTILYTKNLGVTEADKLDADKTAVVTFNDSDEAHAFYNQAVAEGKHNVFWFFHGYQSHDGVTLKQKLYKKHIVKPKDIIEYNKPAKEPESLPGSTWVKSVGGDCYFKESFKDTSKWKPIPGCPVYSAYCISAYAHAKKALMYVQLADNPKLMARISPEQLKKHFNLQTPTAEMYAMAGEPA